MPILSLSDLVFLCDHVLSEMERKPLLRVLQQSEVSSFDPSEDYVICLHWPLGSLSKNLFSNYSVHMDFLEVSSKGEVQNSEKSHESHDILKGLSVPRSTPIFYLVELIPQI